MYKVTNTNKAEPGRDFKAKFDGGEYFFPTGKPVMVDNAAAAHIFGVGMGKDKTTILTRHGWCNQERDRTAGMDILNAFIFELKAEQHEAPLALMGADASTGHGPAPVGQSAAAGGADESPAVAVAASKKAA